MQHYPHHIGDFDKATRHLTRIERSVYRDLMDVYYDTEKMLTLDVAMLCRRILANSETESTAVQQVLNEFFIKTPTGWFHSRCDFEVEKFHGSTSQKSAAGKASALKRALKKQQALNACTTTVEVPLQQNPTNLEPRTDNLEPRTKGGRFAPPTLDELIAEFTGKVLMPEVEAKKFLGYYGSNDWKVGKNKMKSWKHAVAGWAARMPPVEQVLGFEQKHGSTDWADDIINQQQEQPNV